MQTNKKVLLVGFKYEYINVFIFVVDICFFFSRAIDMLKITNYKAIHLAANSISLSI